MAAAPEDGHERGFYSTVDEEAYTAYFQPFRKKQYAEALGGLGLRPGDSLLDVGASYGWLVEVALERGIDAWGVEPGEAMPAPAVADRIARGTLAGHAAGAPRRYDAVTLWHVLEHTSDPAAAVRQAAGLLKPGGRILVAVPNAEGRLFRLSLLARRLGQPALVNALFYFDNPNMHRFYFTPRALERLLAAEGLQPVATSATEAFDWTAMHRRVAPGLRKLAVRAAGPAVGALRLTSRENLIVTARRAGA